MFVRPDFQTKKELKDAVAKGDVVTVWSDVPLPCPVNGELIAVHGPRAAVLAMAKRTVKCHFASPSDTVVWVARVLWKRGKIVLVK